MMIHIKLKERKLRIIVWIMKNMALRKIKIEELLIHHQVMKILRKLVNPIMKSSKKNDEKLKCIKEENLSQENAEHIESLKQENDKPLRNKENMNKEKFLFEKTKNNKADGVISSQITTPVSTVPTIKAKVSDSPNIIKLSCSNINNSMTVKEKISSKSEIFNNIDKSGEVKKPIDRNNNLDNNSKSSTVIKIKLENKLINVENNNSNKNNNNYNNIDKNKQNKSSIKEKNTVSNNISKSNSLSHNDGINNEKSLEINDTLSNKKKIITTSTKNVVSKVIIKEEFDTNNQPLDFSETESTKDN
eukprot:jgi/Orpsp1_1/1191957/evm.model.d7180000089607.2